jgi:hypothetical protein
VPTNAAKTNQDAIIGCNLEPILEERGMDYTKFASIIEEQNYGSISQQCVSRYAKCAITRFDLYSVVTMCRCLGIELGDLLFIENFDTKDRTVPVRNQILRFLRQLAQIGEVIGLDSNPAVRQAFETLRDHLAAICIDEALQKGDALLQSPNGDVVYIYADKIPDFCEFHRLNERDIRRLIAGKILSCKEWTLLETAR